LKKHSLIIISFLVFNALGYSQLSDLCFLPPSITIEPISTIVALGNNGNFNTTDIGTNSYQWQVSTNGGNTFSNINNGTEYSGANTN
jgi:hypothetical protein